MSRKLFALVLSLCMVLSLAVAVHADETINDMGDAAWAASATERWVGYGVISPDADGNFRPNDAMTRGEAADLFAKLLGLTDTEGAQSFKDVPADSPYADAIALVSAAGIMNGVGDDMMTPDAPMSREMFFVIFARAMGIKPQETTSGLAADGSDWSAELINALTDKGYVKGTGNGVEALAEISRASVMTLLDQTVTTYANEPGATVEGTGTGVMLVVADNVTVTGNVDTLAVAAGAAGENGVTVKDATVNQVSVTANVDVALEGETTVDAVAVTETAKGADVTVGETATVATVETAADTTLNVSGTVGAVEVAETATGTAVETTATAKIDTVTTAAENTSVSGEGAVTTVAAAETVAETVAVTTEGTTTTTVEDATPAENTADGTDAGDTTNTTDTTDTTDTTNTNTTTDTASAYIPYIPVTYPVSGVSTANPTARDTRNSSMEYTLEDGSKPAVYSNYSVTATQTEGNNFVLVTVSADGVKNHVNGQNKEGYWTGVRFAATANESYTFKSASSLDGLTEAQSQTGTIDSDGTLDLYMDANKNSDGKWVSLTLNGVETIYYIDLSGVQLDTTDQTLVQNHSSSSSSNGD